jgi:hypothetical protein
MTTMEILDRLSETLLSDKRTMLGWLRAAELRASSSKRRRWSGSFAKEGLSIFTATSRPKRLSRARYPSPIPPEPIFLQNSTVTEDLTNHLEGGEKCVGILGPAFGQSQPHLPAAESGRQLEITPAKGYPV